MQGMHNNQQITLHYLALLHIARCEANAGEDKYSAQGRYAETNALRTRKSLAKRKKSINIYTIAYFVEVSRKYKKQRTNFSTLQGGRQMPVSLFNVGWHLEAEIFYYQLRII